MTPDVVSHHDDDDRNKYDITKCNTAGLGTERRITYITVRGDTQGFTT